jgi:hypothetical protein
MYNFYYRHQDFAVLAIPRCGSESIASGTHLTPRDVALNYPRVVAFVRTPLARCQSGYQFFHKYPNDSRYAPTWEAWIDRILDQPKGSDYNNQTRLGGRVVGEPTFLPVDPHWLPQATIIDEALVQPTEIWQFEQLPTLIPGINHFHQSRPLVVDTTYRITELRTYYAADTALRLTARVV